MSEEMVGRPVPEHLKRLRITVSGGKQYLPAAVRVEWFRSVCPAWGVDTMLLEGGQAAGFATVKAVVTDETGRVIASGMKTETKQDFPAGWVEKAETGAISRALVVAGFPSADSSEFSTGGGYTKAASSAPGGTGVQQGGERPPKQADQETVTAQQEWLRLCEVAGRESEESQRETMSRLLSEHFTEVAGAPRSIKCPPTFKPTAEQFRIAATMLGRELAGDAMDEAA